MNARYALLPVLLLTTPALLAQGAPPANDVCDSVAIALADTSGVLTFEGDNTGATAVGDFEQGSFPFSTGNAAVWHGFQLDECADVTIALCGSSGTFIGHYWDFITTACPAGDPDLIYASSVDTTLCTDSLPTLFYPELPPGTYYVPVLSNENLGQFGPYEVNVTTVPCATGIDELAAGPWSVRVMPGYSAMELRYNGNATDARLVLLDAMGRRIIHRRLHFHPGSIHLLPISDLEPGLYHVELITDGQRSQKALLIAN